ncbi:MAG: esterase/lipase family protein [Silanimonas sp.]
MSPRPSRLASRLSAARAALQLGVAGTVGVTSLAEAVHEAVLATAPLPWLPTGPLVRGLTRAAYGGVRGVAGIGGKGGDAVLGFAEQRAGGDASRATPVDASVPLGLRSALNGIVGDRLVAIGNPLALPMSLEAHHAARRQPHRGARGARVLFIHGLCMNDQHWQTPTGRGEDFGHRLAADAGLRPIYLRYNTGLAIAENGRRLAALLDSRHRGRHAWRGPLHVVAHSLGGLVIRSAIAEGLMRGHRWPERLADVVFLGTPHDGAPLERAGKAVDVALGLSRFSSPWALISALRSVAIQQLGHAPVAAWNERPAGLRLHAVAGVLGATGTGRIASAIGDGLVPVGSALAEGPGSAALAFESRVVVPGVGHLALIRRREVAAHLIRVLT